jgi:hypothetical protein
MKLLHTILSHWEPEKADLLMSYHQRLDPSVELLLAYGGPEVSFDKIDWQKKIFIADPGLRGPTDRQNYCHWMRQATAWAKNLPELPDAVFFTETDHPMLRSGYGQKLAEILTRSQCGFLAKWCSNREGSNSYFYLQYRDDPILRQVLREASGVEDSPIYEALATGMLFLWDVLDNVQTQRIDAPVFTEVIIPSTVRALGYSLGCFDHNGDFMRQVRYRPSFSLNEAVAKRSNGAWCCHPLKELITVNLWQPMNDRRLPENL